MSVPFVNSPAMSDWKVFNVTTKLMMPSTCTYDNWIAKGICSAQWTGLQSLLDLGITLRAYVRDCGSFKIPEFKIECFGSGCGVFTNPEPCVTSASCPTGAYCIDMYDLFYKNITNSTNPDLFGAFFLLNNQPPDSCSNEASGRKMVHDIIRYFANLPADAGTDTGMCFPDIYNKFKTFNFTSWLRAQGQVDGGLITLNTVTAWSPPGVDPVVTLAATITFTVSGNAAAVPALIQEEYPTAVVSTSGGTVTVTFSGSQAQGSAALFAADVGTPGSTNLYGKLEQNGATPEPSTVVVTQQNEIRADPVAASTLSPLLAIVALGAIYLAN
jgi:hypothetical protein